MQAPCRGWRLRDVFVTWLPYNGSWSPEVIQSQAVLDLTGRGGGFDRIGPGFIKRDEIPWVAAHRHGRETMQFYLLGYAFGYAKALYEKAKGR